MKQLVMAKSTARPVSTETFSICSGLAMGRFFAEYLHKKSSDCFYAHDFAAFKEVYA